MCLINQSFKKSMTSMVSPTSFLWRIALEDQNGFGQMVVLGLVLNVVGILVRLHEVLFRLELAVDIGWARGLLLVAFGYALLKSLDRFAFSVCPSCAHDHSHESCDEPLHGFAAPLLIATAIHAFVDGWALVAVESGTRTPGAGTAFAAALLLHKIPEGLALGTLLRASVDRATTAFALCAAVELTTVAGGATGLWLTPAAWINYPLAIAGGTFLFLRRSRYRWRLETPGRLACLHPRAGRSGGCGDSAAGTADCSEMIPEADSPYLTDASGYRGWAERVFVPESEREVDGDPARGHGGANAGDDRGGGDGSHGWTRSA